MVTFLQEITVSENLLTKVSNIIIEFTASRICEILHIFWLVWTEHKSWNRYYSIKQTLCLQL